MSTKSEIKSNLYEGLIIMARHPRNGRAGLRRFSHSSLPSERAGGTLADVGEDEEGGGGGGSVGCLRGPVEKVEKGRGVK